MAIVITRQPKNFAGVVGDMVVFSVEATGEGLTYQWEYLTINSTGWTNNTMSGNNTDTLTFDVRSYHDGYQYRCLITDANGNTLRTNEVKITIIETTDVGFINYSTLAGIADAIRAKTETTESMLPSEMAALINSISTGLDLPTIKAIDTGTFTPSSTVSALDPIEHSLGEIPDFFYCVCTSALTTSNGSAFVSQCTTYHQSLSVKQSSGVNEVEWELYSSISFINSSTGVLTTNSELDHLSDGVMSATGCDVLTTSSRKLISGKNYRWICIKFA